MSCKKNHFSLSCVFFNSEVPQGALKGVDGEESRYKQHWLTKIYAYMHIAYYILKHYINSLIGMSFEWTDAAFYIFLACHSRKSTGGTENINVGFDLSKRHNRQWRRPWKSLKLIEVEEVLWFFPQCSKSKSAKVSASKYTSGTKSKK